MDANITWKYGLSGQIVISVNSCFYCSVDNWLEFTQERTDIITRFAHNK